MDNSVFKQLHEQSARISALESALNEAKSALEYVGCHEHTEADCKCCTVVDNALDTIRKLKESK